MAKPKQPSRDRETVRTLMKDLPVKLTEEESKLRGKTLAKEVAALKDIEDKKKLATAAWNKDLKDQRKKVLELTEIVNTDMENREVPCVEEKVHSQGVVEIVRTDTFEVVESRGMTEGERQIVLDMIVNTAAASAEPALANHPSAVAD